MAAPRHVSLLQQAKCQTPRDYLAARGMLSDPLPTATLPPVSNVGSQRLLLHLIALAHSGASDESELAAPISHLVSSLAGLGFCSDRQRILFLVAVLAGDKACAIALSRSGAAAELCTMLELTGPDALPTMHLHWAFVALA